MTGESCFVVLRGISRDLVVAIAKVEFRKEFLSTEKCLESCLYEVMAKQC